MDDDERVSMTVRGGLLAAAMLLTAVPAHARDGLVVLLFDDGRPEHAAYATPILEGYGLRGTFAVISGNIDVRSGSMTSNDVVTLARAGHEIVDHTLHHTPSFWGNSENATAWEDTVMKSLAIFRSMGLQPRGWDQPGGEGQGFPGELRDVLARHYDYSVGRVGLDGHHQRNFHWNQIDDLFSLGRGGVYSYGYNAPGRPHAAEIRTMIERTADGYARGLVVVPAFHALRSDDSSTVALEAVCNFIARNALVAVRWGDAVDRVRRTPDFVDPYGEQIPNPGFAFDRDGNGRPDGWFGVTTAPGFARIAPGAWTELYGPDRGSSVIRLSVRAPGGASSFRIDLALTRIDENGRYSTSVVSLPHRVSGSWTNCTDTLFIAPDVDRVRITFRGFSGTLNATGLSWTRLPPDTAETRSDKPPVVIGLDQYPNPFRDWTRIVYDTPRPATATLNIFDARGRLVRRLAKRRLNAGRHEFVWNGRDSRGTRVAAGVYFCCYRALGETLVRRMILLP